MNSDQIIDSIFHKETYGIPLSDEEKQWIEKNMR